MGNIIRKTEKNYIYYPSEDEKEKVDVAEGTEMKDMKDETFPFEYIVIEGGGAKIIPACGAVRVLYKYNIVQQLTKFAGSSAGAILATALACGFTSDEIDKLMLDTDFTKFQDDDIGIIRDTFRFSNKYGVCSGDYFLMWMDQQIERKLHRHNATFRDLKEYKNTYLYITSLCVEDDKTHIFSYENTPNMSISKAVRMSMSIPFLFCPVKHNGKYYVDGGVSNNYPINIFDIDGKDNNKTLGLKLMAKNEKRDGKIYTDKLKTNTLLEFSGSIISHILNEMERREVDDNYWSRTITINTGDIKTMEFDISRKKRLKHITLCYDETLEALEKYKKYKRFQ